MSTVIFLSLSFSSPQLRRSSTPPFITFVLISLFTFCVLYLFSSSPSTVSFASFCLSVLFHCWTTLSVVLWVTFPCRVVSLQKHTHSQSRTSPFLNDTRLFIAASEFISVLFLIKQHDRTRDSGAWSKGCSGSKFCTKTSDQEWQKKFLPFQLPFLDSDLLYNAIRGQAQLYLQDLMN